MTSDEQLILELQQGSDAAFTELFLRYRERVYGFFRRRMNDAAQAEELAQETFLAVLRAAQGYEPRATFRAYLFGIAFNILTAHRRKSALNTTQSDSAPEEVPYPSGTNPENVIWVRQAVERLDDAEREVLLLREFEELSYEEIAKMLHAPVNTVRSRLFRARLALREILATTPGNLGGRK
ncbi:MAG TPA: RNA polymerase sigma factor [Candidatus Sulfotelmatobacter sp.]|nr:RNA polymerase sigma factor [Candidatus Sulfotelmatobacter sp.]